MLARSLKDFSEFKDSCVTFNQKKYNYVDLSNLASSYVDYIREKFHDTQVIPVITKRSENYYALLMAMMELEKTVVPLNEKTTSKHLSDVMEQLSLNRYLRMNENEIHVESINQKSSGIKTVPKETAYIIFTSGSTGTPKGVMISNQNLETLSSNIKNIFNLSSDNQILAQAAFNFDMSIVETFVALKLGLNIYLWSEKDRLNPNILRRTLKSTKLDIAQLTPSALKMYLSGSKNVQLNNIKHLVVGGEAVTKETISNVFDSKCNNVYNFYGPTETTVWNSYKRIKSASDTITLGQAFTDNSIMLKNADGESLKIDSSEEGEIVICGKQVGLGYISESDAKLGYKNSCYYTGDYGYYYNNEIVFIGRKDNQIKIKGFRVEPEEIEYYIRMHQDVRECCVLKYRDDLIAAVSFINEVDLKSYLKEVLQDYKIPNKVYKLDEIPLSQSMKVNRKSVYQQIEKLSLNSNEPKIIQSVADLLDTKEDVQNDSNLLDLGYDSLKLATLFVQLEEEFAIDILSSDVNIGEIETVQDLIVLVETLKSD